MDKYIIIVEINGCDIDICFLMGDICSVVVNYMKKIGKLVMVLVWVFGLWMFSNNWDCEFVV